MSTKTSIKRLALVVVSTLGFSFLSIAPSNAAVTTDTYTSSTGASTAASSTTPTVAATTNLILSGIADAANATMTTTFVLQSAPINSAGAAVSYADTAGAAHVNSGFAFVAPTGTLTATAAGRTTRYITASFTPDVVGTYVILLTSNGDTNDQTVTWTITVTATPAVTAANSTSIINAGEVVNGAADVTVNASKALNADQRASIVVTAKNSAGTDLSGSTAVTATISGPGLLGISNVAGVAAQAATARALTGAAGQNVVGVFSDGTAGVATITISVGATVLATETVTFYGAITAIAFNRGVYSMPDSADGVLETDVDAIVGYITASDASGVAVPVAAGDFTVSSAAELTAQVLTNAAAVDLTAARTLTTGAVLPATTKAAIVVDPTADGNGSKTITITHTATTVTTSATFVVSEAIGTGTQVTTMVTDKSSYLPGEKVTVTVSSVDASGNIMADGAGNYLTAAGSTSTTSMQGTLPAQSVTLVNGKASYTLYAPLASGKVVISATSAATAAQALAATFDVSGGAGEVAAEAATDAALEAIDAANAATDAANLAAEAADAATVAAEEARDAADAATAAVEALAAEVATMIDSLKAQLTTLAKVVAKIAKRVKA